MKAPNQTGIEAISREAQRLAELAAAYPSGETKAVLFRAAALLFEHSAQCISASYPSDAEYRAAFAEWEKGFAAWRADS